MQPHRAVRILENPKHSPKDVELHNLEKQMIAYLNDGAIQSGLEITLETIDRFPEKPTLTHSWTIYFYTIRH